MSICPCWGLEESLGFPQFSTLVGRGVGTRLHSQTAGDLCSDGQGHKRPGPSRAGLSPNCTWERGGGRLGPRETLLLWDWIKAVLGAGQLKWAGSRGRRTQLRHRHFKNLLLFHLNSPPPQDVPPRMAFPLWNQGPRICAPLCWKEGIGGGKECLLPGQPVRGWGGAPTGQALAGVYGGGGPSQANCQVTQFPGQCPCHPLDNVSMTTCSFMPTVILRNRLHD